MQIILKKLNDHCFHVVYASDREKVSKLSVAAMHKCTITQARNYEHHKKLFAILSVAVENGNDFINVDQVLHYVKLKSGHFDLMEVAGDIYKIPKSIAFENMDQIDFNEFYNKTVGIIADYLGITPAELENESPEYL